jgi:hypothetical protein
MQRFQDFRPYKRVPMTEEELQDLLAQSAIQFVVEDEEWGAKEASVADMTPYYSFTGELEAYAIELKVAGERSFTVIGGANLKHPPIIQAYEGVPPHHHFADLHFFDADKGRCELDGLEFKRNLYLGAFCYGVEVDDAGKTRYLDLTRYREIPPSFVEQVRTRPQVPKEAEDPEEKEPVDHEEVDFVKDGLRMEMRLLEWNYLGSHSSWHYGYISGVPRCEWDSSGTIPGGCSPCAATMVLGYWGRKRYGTLPYITWSSMGSDPDEDTLQNALEAAMRTDSTGTTQAWNIDNGIRDVLADYNCSGFRVTNHWTGDRTDFIRGVNRVNDRHPFLVNVHGSDIYQNHSMCCVGYKYNDGGFWHPWHSMYYKCLTTWASDGTNWVYVSYAEGDWLMQTTVTR